VDRGAVLSRAEAPCGSDGASSRACAEAPWTEAAESSALRSPSASSRACAEARRGAAQGGGGGGGGGLGAGGGLPQRRHGLRLQERGAGKAAVRGAGKGTVRGAGKGTVRGSGSEVPHCKSTRPPSTGSRGRSRPARPAHGAWPARARRRVRPADHAHLEHASAHTPVQAHPLHVPLHAGAHARTSISLFRFAEPMPSLACTRTRRARRGMPTSLLLRASIARLRLPGPPDAGQAHHGPGARPVPYKEQQ
jgi:hypothetical protein